MGATGASRGYAFGVLLAFFVAWLLGATGIVLSGEVDDGWRALLVPAGLILIALGVRLLRDRHAWMAFVESQSKVLRHPGGRVTRRFTGIGLVIIGLGWMIGGVVGLYDLGA